MSSSSSKLRASVPAKSCLSTRKKNAMPSASADSMTPRRILHNSPSEHNDNDGNDDDIVKNDKRAKEKGDCTGDGTSSKRPSTPTDHDCKDDEDDVALSDARHRAQPSSTSTRRYHQPSAVKFGNNTAAEFDSQLPITHMTPMPDTIVLRIFPLDGRDADAIVAGEGESRETARNVAMLAEWDDDFDGFVDNDDDDDDVDDDENKNVYDEVAGMIDADENDMGGGTDRVGGRDMHGIGPGKKGRATSQPLAPGGRTMKRGRKRTPYKKDGGGIGGQGGNGRRGGGRVGSSSSSRRRESRSYAEPEHAINIGGAQQ